MHRIIFRPLRESSFDKKLFDLGVTCNGRSYAFRDVVRMWNKLFGDLLEEVVRFYNELGEKVVEKNRQKVGGEVGVALGFSEFLSRVVHGVEVSGVDDKISGLAMELYGVLKEFYRVYRIPVFRRMMRFLRTWFGSLYRVEYESAGRVLGDYFVFAPELVALPRGLGIASAFGGYVAAVVEMFKAGLKGVSLDVITSSVDDSNVEYVQDIVSLFSLRMIGPSSGLRYYRVSVDYHRGVRGFTGGWWKKSGSRDFVYVRSLADLFGLLRKGSRNVAVVVDKESMLLLAKGFEQLGWGVEYGRDSENPSVVDYVVVRRPTNDSVILMFHPHGRCSMGVDPPFRDEIESVVVALGVRGRPRYMVPVPRVFRRYARRLLEGKVVALEDWTGLYVVVKCGWLLIYDVFSLKYDIHMLAQVVGRFFLSRSMVNLVVNGRYDLRWVSRVKYFVFVSPSGAGRVFKVKYVGKDSGEELGTEFNVRLLNVPAYSVRAQYVEVDVSRFSSSGYVVVDVGKVWRWMYGKLRSVYNSLRYCRVQLRYGRGVDEWWLYKKLVYLVSGFEYARLEGKDVPAGLKRMYEVYLISGIRGLLEYVYSRYLSGLDPGVWRNIKRRIKRVFF